MSGGQRDQQKGGGGKGAPKGADRQKGEPEVEFKPALKPQRGIFLILLGVFVVWVIGLIVLYFKTVYPMRRR